MKKNKFLFLFAILLTLTMVTSTTYAAVVEFYKDTGRIQVTGGTFNYSHNAASVANVNVTDGNLFTVSGNNRTVNVTFTINASPTQRINYAIYYEQQGAGIEYVRAQTSGVGFVNAGTTNATKIVRIKNFNNNNTPKSVRIGVILITLAEYNANPTQIIDSYSGKTYSIPVRY